VSHAVHMPTHIFIQHGMWNEVANQNIRAFNVAKELWQPGDVPGDMSHSGDWGQYGFLQLGDYAGARERIQAFEWMATTTKNPRASGALSLVRARYIIETEEWKVQPVAENASNETILANGFSAVKTGDMATAEKMAAALYEKRKVSVGGAPAPANPHAEHGAAPAPAPAMAPGGPDSGRGVTIMHKELQALIAQAKGQTDEAIALLKEAAGIEESMRPPNGAADPVKPSHELLGEVLLQAGKAKEAADAFETSLLRMPNRARSLMGAVKAHTAAGNKEKAAERLATLNSFWKGKPFTNPGTDAR
jgi:tetratricopeptide (TPR) repeat protein